jgi:hypothetical protein
METVFFPDIFAKHDLSHVFIAYKFGLNSEIYIFSLHTFTSLQSTKMLFGTLVLYYGY